MARIDQTNYYLDIASTVAGRSTCLRRCYGAILVKHDEIIATGYNGAPRGRKNCVDLSYCTREAMQIPSGERYELCRSVHAEANCVISAARREALDSTLYLACLHPRDASLIPDSSPCSMCRRLIINAGVRKVVVRDTKTQYRVFQVQDWVDGDDSLPAQMEQSSIFLCKTPNNP
ncbi:MAG: cytidine deaminase [Oscillospiraceae bacterium]|nr:cytidine deaminase [Oscillospiraceae bacterium]